MTDTKRIRVGVVGVGYLGQHHARLYKEIDSVQLVGVYDTNRERAAEIAAQQDCTAFESALDLARECDAVSIVVPTDRHCDVALEVLSEGCHTLIEKPLCTSLEEAEKILAAAQAVDALVQVGHVEHFNPVMDYLEGAVQRPQYITADRLAPFNPRGTEVGVVLDLMIHDIGVVLELVRSPIERIDAVGVNVLSQSEDIANARLQFANGCVANLNTSRVSLKKIREIRVFQPSAYLSLNFMEQKGHLLRKVGLQLQREDIPINKGEPLRLELESFIECVHQQNEPKVSGGLGKTALEVSLQITQQIREQMQRLSTDIK